MTFLFPFCVKTKRKNIDQIQLDKTKYHSEETQKKSSKFDTMGIIENIGGIIIFIVFVLIFRLYLVRFDKIFKNSEKIEDLERQNNQLLEEIREIKELLKKKD